MNLSGFTLWLEAASPLEEQVFAAAENEKVSQHDFGSLLQQWVKESSFYTPKMAGPLPRTYDAPYNTTYLTGQYSQSLGRVARDRTEEHGFSGIGLIVQPYTIRYLRTDICKNFDSVGIDNGLYGEAGKVKFTWDKYEKLIKIALAQEKRGVLKKLNFFTVPDEPFNWEKTMRKFQEHRPLVQTLRSWGAPVAVCIQEGAKVATVPWNEIDVIFIGGKNKFKTGEDAHAIVQEAQKRSVPVHMGRVNTVGRMHKASEWGVHTADGTYFLHELGKSLHEIERTNPQRLKRLLYGRHIRGDKDVPTRHYTEPQIVDDFVMHVLDIQKNSWIQKRYNAILDLIRRSSGNPVTRREIIGLDNFLPQVPGMQPDEDVVEYDAQGNVLLDRRGMPVRSDQFNRLGYKMKRRPLPPGIPYDEDNYKVYDDYMKKYVAQMRERGVMPL